MEHIDQILNKVILIVHEAASLISVEQQRLTVETKSQGNFVTSVDTSVEDFLRTHLLAILPQAGFIAEESSPLLKDINWVVDPIDGTGNMLSGFPFSISVALAQEGSVLLGVVYCPSTQALYSAIPGRGAFVRYGSFSVPRRIQVKQSAPNEGVVLFGVPYDRQKAHSIFYLVELLYASASDVKRIGPASLDISVVAEGNAKLYVEYDLQPWDYAAAKLILEEAGGFHVQNGSLHIFSSSKELASIVCQLS